jgi:hypothetical protein
MSKSEVPPLTRIEVIDRLNRLYKHQAESYTVAIRKPNLTPRDAMWLAECERSLMALAIAADTVAEHYTGESKHEQAKSVARVIDI